jgi:hypothetical protein
VKARASLGNNNPEIMDFDEAEIKAVRSKCALPRDFSDATEGIDCPIRSDNARNKLIGKDADAMQNPLDATMAVAGNATDTDRGPDFASKYDGEKDRAKSKTSEGLASGD